jgi:hypothetical protein
VQLAQQRDVGHDLSRQERHAAVGAVLVLARAAQLDLTPVQQHLAALVHLDLADPDLGVVAAVGAARRRRLGARPVEMGRARLPELRVPNGRESLEGDRAAALDHARAEVSAHAADPAADADSLLAPGVVPHGRAEEHPRAAVDASQRRAHEQALDVDAVDLAQVDLAQDAAVVPPAAAGAPVGLVARGRDVGCATAVVDANDEMVHAAARVAHDDLERDERPLVAADLAAVQVHASAVVDRLEAELP